MMRISENLLALALVCLFSATTHAQEAQLQIRHLDRLAASANESVEITLDELRLRALSKLLTLDAKQQQLRETLGRLRGVYIRGFEFAADNAYSEADVEAVRQQLRAPGWKRIAEVRGRSGATDEVYLLAHGGMLAGFTHISAAPRRLCVVNLTGQLSLDDVGLLENNFRFNNCALGKGGRRSDKEK